MQKLSILSSINHVVEVAVPGLNIRKVLIGSVVPIYTELLAKTKATCRKMNGNKGEVKSETISR
jgi:hypothetical protein